MNKYDALAKLKSVFVYKSDSTPQLKTDSWNILSLDNAAGDCEDFSLTLMKMIYGSIFMGYIKGASMHFCYYQGVGHAVMFDGTDWADNIQNEWFDIHEISAYTEIKRLSLFNVYSRMISAKIRKLF